MKKMLALAVIAFSPAAAFAQSVVTVQVNQYSFTNFTQTGFAGVNVALVPFTPAGEPDPANTQLLVTGPAGSTATVVVNNLDYQIIITTPGYGPSARDQIMDPNGSFHVKTAAAVTKTYTLFQNGQNCPGCPVLYTMNVAVSSIPAVGDLLMGEVYYNDTNKDPVAFGIFRATDVVGTTFPIFDVPASNAGSYGVHVSVPTKDKALDLLLGSDFPGGSSTVQMDLSNALPPIKFGGSVSTSAPSVDGVILSTANKPVDGMEINISSYSFTPDPSCNCFLPIFQADTFTDANGRFQFFNVPVSTYNFYASKLGFYSVGTQLQVLSATVTYRQNFQVKAATYSLAGVVRYSGVPMPWGNVNFNGDGDAWGGSDSYSTASASGFGFSHGAFFNANLKLNGDGTFAVVGIPDGNVAMSVGFRGGFYDFNAGPNNQRDYNGYVRGNDDMRITITSTTVANCPAPPASNLCYAGTSIVYNAAGAIVSTGPVVVNLNPPAGANAGTINITINFVTAVAVSTANPVVIPLTRPVTLMASEQYHGGNQTQKLGVASLIGTFTSPTTSYVIHVPTGTQYQVDVFSQDWGKLSNHNDTIDFTSTNTASFVFDITRSGRLTGTVKFPDGTNYKPIYGNPSSPNVHFINLNVTGVTVNANEGAQVDNFGNFEFPNLAPGQYSILAQPQGGGAKWPTVELDDVKVYQGQTTNVNVRLKDAIYVQPQILGLPTVSTPSWVYSVQAVPAGTRLTQSVLTSLFNKQQLFVSQYSTTTATFSTILMEPGTYDFYLMLNADYKGGDKGTGAPTDFFFFKNFIGLTKGQVIQKSDVNPNLGTVAQPITIGVLGALGQATVTGHIKGTKLFTLDDVKRIFANFDNEIFNQIPALLMYDDAGDIKGFSMGLPDATGIVAVQAAINNNDPQAFLNGVQTTPLQYAVSSIPPGHYTGVFLNPNYPPVVKDITLNSGLNTFDFDFDSQQILAGTISGVVVSSTTGQGIPKAAVSIVHRTVTHVVQADDNGKFSVANLPSGIFRIEASKGGFTTGGQKVALPINGTLTLTIPLYPTAGTIQGTVYLTKFPTPQVKDGIQVIAYDETANVKDPEAYLPHITALTDSDGNYLLPGVLGGDQYKLSVAVPGKLLQTLLVTASTGPTAAPDIILKDAPPQISLRLRKNPDNANKIDILVKSPKSLRSNPSGSFNTGSSYNASSAVALTFVPGPDNTFTGQFTLSATERYYTIRVVAGDAQNQLEKVVVYDKVSDTRADQFVDQAAVAGGEVNIDEDREDYSGLDMDPGSLTATSTGTASDFTNLVGGFFSALPSVRMVKTGRGDASLESVLVSIMASDVYNIDLSSAQQNKTLTLSLKYDKSKITDTGSLQIREFDAASGNWILVPGNATVDPLSGVVSIEIDSIQNATTGTGTSSPLKARHYARARVSAQGTFVPDQSQASSQTGQFAVFSAAPSTNVSYAGEKFELYNLPNPFNLKTKTLNISSDGTAIYGATHDVRGTLIKYHLPPGKAGHVRLSIFNVAGERVRQLDEGIRSGGFVYYSEWDGKNDSGSDCASGVYFLLAQMDNKKLGKAHKMALVK